MYRLLWFPFELLLAFVKFPLQLINSNTPNKLPSLAFLRHLFGFVF